MKIHINFLTRDKLITLLFYLLFSTIGITQSNAQYVCGTDEHPNAKRTESTQRITTTCSQTIYVKVNFHFMLKSDGSGNFTEYDDGLGNTANTGYSYAQGLIEGSNYNLSHNVQTRQPIGNTVPVPTMNLQYVISGIYFHRNDTYYDYTQTNNKQLMFGVDQSSEINIFLGHYASGSGGIAGSLGYINNTSQWVQLAGVWENYQIGRGGWYYTGLLNHEIGHLLGLYHPFQFAQCADTYHTKSSWCDAIYDDNNMMDYNCWQNAVTPCQWGIMQSTLDNYYGNYSQCCSTTPVTALYSLRSNACSGDNIYLDGSWRSLKNEQNYSLEIYQTTAVGSNTNSGNYYSQSFTGQYGNINLSNLYTFTPGNVYRVSLTANGTNCTSTDSDVRWITIQNDIVNLQNSTITSNNDYFSKCHYKIGNHVDAGSASGDVTISSPAVINVKSGRTISLEVGTTINSGATASFNISPYSYSFANIAYKTDNNTDFNNNTENETANSSPTIQFFPNPSKGTSSIVLNYNESKPVKLSILNSMGEEFYTQDLGIIKECKVDVDLMNKPNGFYIIKVKSSDETETLKFILSK